MSYSSNEHISALESVIENMAERLYEGFQTEGLSRSACGERARMLRQAVRDLKRQRMGVH